MPAPVYPTILTKANWDANKGAIGKAPSELGIGPAIVNAETSFHKIDWNIPGNYTQRQLRDIPHPILVGLCLAMQVQEPRVQAAYEALLTLANVASGVVSRYERSVTFPKPTIEHVRKIQQTATEFSIPVRDGLDPEVKLLRKARGLAKLGTFNIQQVINNNQLSHHFLVWSRTKHCDLNYEFLMDFLSTAQGQPPPIGPRAAQLYNKYMADNNVNISEDAYLVLKNLYTAGTLVNPPDNARREEVRLAWTRAYNEAKSMFKQQMPEWVRSLRLDDDNSTLLCDVLQT